MARPGALSLDGAKAALVRTIPGTIAADSATLTDASFPVAAAIDATGYDTVFFGVEIDGGSSPTATLELLFRDEDAPDGQRWKRFKFGALEGVVAPGSAAANQTTGALSSGLDMVELVTLGASKIFVRVTAVANSGSTTAMRILAKPGIVRPQKALVRG